MKKTIIATAVSAALMAPVAAQADVTVYGRIHQGIKLVNPEMGDSKTDFVGIGSRFGIKASSDVGNGMTVSAQYEFQVDSDVAKTKATDNRDGNAIKQTRLAKVGVSGGFGSVDLGQQWSAYYNSVGVAMDPMFALGSLIYSSVVGGPYRTGNTIKYSNSFGPVSLELDVRMDDAADGQGDGHAVGASFAVNDNISLAAAIDNTKDGKSMTGGSIKVSLGDYWASVAQQSHDPDDDNDPEISATHLWAGGSFGNTSAMIGMGSADKGGMDSDPGNDPGEVKWGVYHSLGGGLGLLYEGRRYDADKKDMDHTTHVFGVRMDF